MKKCFSFSFPSMIFYHLPYQITSKQNIRIFKPSKEKRLLQSEMSTLIITKRARITLMTWCAFYHFLYKIVSTSLRKYYFMNHALDTYFWGQYIKRQIWSYARHFLKWLCESFSLFVCSLMPWLVSIKLFAFHEVCQV